MEGKNQQIQELLMKIYGPDAEPDDEDNIRRKIDDIGNEIANSQIVNRRRFDANEVRTIYEFIMKGDFTHKEKEAVILTLWIIIHELWVTFDTLCVNDTQELADFMNTSPNLGIVLDKRTREKCMEAWHLMDSNFRSVFERQINFYIETNLISNDPFIDEILAVCYGYIIICDIVKKYRGIPTHEFNSHRDNV